jgi:hypothetical protein
MVIARFDARPAGRRVDDRLDSELSRIRRVELELPVDVFE